MMLELGSVLILDTVSTPYEIRMPFSLPIQMEVKVILRILALLNHTKTKAEGSPLVELLKRDR